MNCIYLFYCLNFYLANIQAKVKFGLKLVEKKNKKTFLEIKENKINLTFGALKLHFSNLFNGNKELGKYFKL